MIPGPQEQDIIHADSTHLLNTFGTSVVLSHSSLFDRNNVSAADSVDIGGELQIC